MVYITCTWFEDNLENMYLGLQLIRAKMLLLLSEKWFLCAAKFNWFVITKEKHWYTIQVHTFNG